MSLATVSAEIGRFLSSDEPEVICIRGAWGVGKTFTWKMLLRQAVERKSLSLSKYSYVSLFGMTSLDELRFSIFQNTVTGDKIGQSPDASSVQELLKDPRQGIKMLKPLLDAGASYLGQKGALDVLSKSAFSFIREQLICIDDLERAGAELMPRDILGLSSQLKEERQCKVVFLLNEEEISKEKTASFKKHLEKVVDISIEFNISPEDATSIAFQTGDKLHELLAPNTERLGIRNIRVISKIKRLAARLHHLLEGRDEAVIERAMASLVLASWCVQEPSRSPGAEFLRAFSLYGDKKTDDPEARSNRDLVLASGFQNDDFDRAILRGAEAGYFEENEIAALGEKLEHHYRSTYRGYSEFSRTWQELYHGSLAVEDDDFLSALFDSAMREAEYINPSNLNDAAKMLREYGHADKANTLVESYVKKRDNEGPDFFETGPGSLLSDEVLDPELKKRFKERLEQFLEDDAPIDAILRAASKQGWSQRDLLVICRISVDELENFLEGLTGKSLRDVIELLFLLSRSGFEGSDVIKRRTVEALRRIASKSPLRRRKIRGYGITFEDE